MVESSGKNEKLRELLEIFEDKGYLDLIKSKLDSSWKTIIDDFKHKQDSHILEEFRKCLLTNLENSVLEKIYKACETLTILRNPLSHRETISIEKVMDMRIEIITLLNPVINSLYNLKKDK